MLEAVGAAVEAAAASERSIALVFCGRTNASAGAALNTAFNLITRRAQPFIESQLNAVKEIFETLGGLWLEDDLVPDAFFPLVCHVHLQVASNSACALEFESLAVKEIFPTQASDFPLATLLKAGATEGLCAELGLSLKELNLEFFNEGHDHHSVRLQNFRAALLQIGATKGEVVGILRLAARLALTLEEKTDEGQTQADVVQNTCYKIHGKILALLQSLTRTIPTQSSTTPPSKERLKRVTLLAVPIEVEKSSGALKQFFTNHLADKILLQAHSVNLDLIPNEDEVISLVQQTNHFLWNNLRESQNQKDMDWRQNTTGDSFQYTHYIGSVVYKQNLFLDDNFDILMLNSMRKNVNGVMTSVPIFIHVDSKAKKQEINGSNHFCSIDRCSYCAGFSHFEKYVSDIVSNVHKSLEQALGSEIVSQIRNVVSESILGGSNMADIIQAKYEDNVRYAEFCRIEFLTGLIKRWEIDAFDVCQQLTPSGLYKIVHEMEKFKIFSQTQIPNALLQASQNILQHRRWLFLHQETETVEKFKAKVTSLVKKLPPKVIKCEMEFITALKKYLRSQKPSDVLIKSLNLASFASGAESIQTLCTRLQKNIEDPSVIAAIQKIPQGESRFHLQDLLEEYFARYLKAPKLQECLDGKVLEVKGYVIELRQVLPQLVDRLRRVPLKEVRFVAKEVFHLDESISGYQWSGVSIHIRTPLLRVVDSQKIDVSGKSNILQHPDAGRKPDGTGEDGKNGYPGIDGGDITLDASKVENAANLTLYSNGGVGGKGQDGGQGRNGTDGVGMEVKRFRSHFDTHIKTKCNPSKLLEKMIKNVHEGSYLEVTEPETGLQMIYNFDRSRLMNTSTFFICRGTPGTIGMSGGFGGQGGEGGRPGIITAPQGVAIKAEKGLQGLAGAVGKHGLPGRNGWDIGYHDRAFWDKPLYYGLARNKKINLMKTASEGPRRSPCKYFKCHIEITTEILPSPLQSYLFRFSMNRHMTMQQQTLQNTTAALEIGPVSKIKEIKRKKAQTSAATKRVLFHSQSTPGYEIADDTYDENFPAATGKENSDFADSLVRGYAKYEKALLEINLAPRKYFCRIEKVLSRFAFIVHCKNHISDKDVRMEMMKLITEIIEKNEKVNIDFKEHFDAFIEQKSKLMIKVMEAFNDLVATLDSEDELRAKLLSTYSSKGFSLTYSPEMKEVFSEFHRTLVFNDDILPDDSAIFPIINMHTQNMNKSNEMFARIAYCMPNTIWETMELDVEKFKDPADERFTSLPDMLLCFGSATKQFCMLDTGNVCSTSYDLQHHNLVSKRMAESALKGTLLANALKHGTTGKVDENLKKPMFFGTCCNCKEEDQKLILKNYSQSPHLALVDSYLKTLSLSQFDCLSFVHILAERLPQMSCINDRQLLFILNYTIEAYYKATTEVFLIQWILAVRPCTSWIKDITVLHIETFTKAEISTHGSLYSNINTVSRSDVLVMFNEYLQNENFNKGFNAKTAEKIFQFLPAFKEPVDVQMLELVEWPNVLKIHALRATLHERGLGELLDQAVSHITSIEHVFGAAQAQSVLEKLLVADKLSIGENFTSLINSLLTGKELIPSDIDASVSQIFESVKNFEYSMDEIEKLSRLISEVVAKSKHRESEFYSGTATKQKVQMKQFKKELSRENLELTDEPIIRALEFLDHKIYLLNGYRLRNTQKVAILLMLLNKNGTILQVNTGEGKSLIVASVAIIKVLMGHKVDVITSSAVLAKRDADTMKNLFEQFDIKVHHNCEEEFEKRREAYEKNDIIYGEISGFQRDFLLHQFYNKDILGERNFDQQTVIVDEVDSMLLDKGNNMLYLSHEIPGFDKLQSVYIFIWKRINNIRDTVNSLAEETTRIKDEFLNDLYGQIKIDDIKKIESTMTTSTAKALFASLTALKIIDERGKLLITSLELVTVDKLYERLKADHEQLLPRLVFLLRSVLARITEISIPRYFCSFVEEHIDKWIGSAVNALFMIEKQDYIVDVDRGGSRLAPRIVILDRDTGTDLTNSQWDEALHQFLQLKHGLHLTTQTLKAVFISNTTFLKKYSHLCGISGTLGSMREKQLLAEVYGIDYATLPPNRRKQFQLLEPKLLKSKEGWIAEIKREIKDILTCKRSILIICDTVEDVNTLNRELKGDDQDNVFTYTRDYEEFVYAEKKKLAPGIVILSTNLAGRGTDVSLEETLIKNGGLHVCVSYLAPNDRVEQQALGRAARCGQPGSGRIICYVEESADKSFYTLEVKRGINEIRRVSDIKTFYETQVKMEEECLEMFHEVYKKARTMDCKEIFNALISPMASTLSNTGVIEKVFVGAGKQKMVVKEEVYNVLQRQILDDWAFWLDSNGHLISKCRTESARFDILTNLNKFLNNTIQKDWRSLVEHNPWTSVRFIKLLVLNGAFDLAVDICKRVVESEPQFAYSARYYLTFVALGTSSQIEERVIEILEENLHEAKELMIMQKRAIDINTLNVSHQKKEVQGLSSLAAFEEQQSQIKYVFDSFLGSITQMVGKQLNLREFLPAVDENLSVDLKLLPELQKALTDAKIIVPYSIATNLNTHVIDKIAYERGILPQKIHEILQTFKSKSGFSKEDLIDSISNELRLPSKENFWKCLKEGGLLHNEKEIAAIARVELNSYDPILFHKIESKIADGILNVVNVDKLKGEEGRILLQLREWKLDVGIDQFVFKMDDLLSIVSSEVLKTFERMGVLHKNIVGELHPEELAHFSFPCYDFLTMETFKGAKIDDNEISSIVQYLESTSVLRRDGTSLRLNMKSNNIDEIDLEPFPVYKCAVRAALEVCFSFRAAADEIMEQASNGEKTMSVPLPDELEESLFESLIESRQVKCQTVAKTPLNTKKITSIVNKIFKTKDDDTLTNFVIECLQNCQSGFIKDKKSNPTIKNISHYLPGDRDFDVVLQFENNNEADVMEWSEALHQNPITRVLDMEALLSIGKVMYVSQKFLEKISDDKSNNAVHDKLFRVKIHDKFDAFFDKKMIIMINKLSFVVRFLLQWFFPRAYLLTKFGFATIQSGLGHALDWIAKVHEQQSMIQKSQYVDLMRIGAYETNVKGKMDAYDFSIRHSAALEMIEKHLNSLIDKLTQELVDESRGAANKSNLRVVYRFNEWLDAEVDVALQSLFQRIFDNIRTQFDLNLSQPHSRRSWTTIEGISKILEWPEKDFFVETAKLAFDRLFRQKSIMQQGQDEEEKRINWEASFEVRLRSLVSTCIKCPVWERVRPKLREAARRTLSTADKMTDLLKRDENEIGGKKNRRVNQNRKQFQSHIWQLMMETKDTKILAFAIAENVPLRGDIIVALFPLIEHFLQNFLRNHLIVVRNKTEKSITGSENIYVNVSPEDFIPVVCPKDMKSVFSDIFDHTDLKISSSTISKELAQLVLTEFQGHCHKALSEASEYNKKFYPIKAEQFTDEVKQYLGDMYDVIRGRKAQIDLDNMGKYQVVENVKGFSPGAVDAAFHEALAKSVEHLVPLLNMLGIKMHEDHLHGEIEHSIEDTQLDILTLELKLGKVVPGIFAVEKAVLIMVHHNGEELSLSLTLRMRGDNVFFNLSHDSNNVNPLAGKIILNPSKEEVKKGNLPTAVIEMLPCHGKVAIVENGVTKKCMVQHVVLSPIRQKKKSRFSLDYDPREINC